MRGPIDYIVVGFEGNKFDGSILQALGEALDKGTIGLVALSLVMKNAEGVVSAVSIADVDDSALADFANKYPVAADLITQDDIDEVADLLNENSSAGLLVIEQLWAKPLKAAIVKANGFLIAEGRIHPDAANELNDKEEA